MVNPYPPYQQPRKLERSRSNKVLGGVCGGVANYVNMDPTLVRVLTVVISLFTGVPVILYLIALFVIPEEGAGSGPTTYPPVNPPQYGQNNTSADFSGPSQPSYAPVPGGPTGAQPHYGSAYGSAGGEDAVWGTEGAPWEQRQPHAGDASTGWQPVPETPARSAPVETADLGATTPAHPATESAPGAESVPATGSVPASESVPAPEGEQTLPPAEETSRWETTGSEPKADGGSTTDPARNQ